MPYSATLEDIMNFLGESSQFILPAGVHMVLNQQVSHASLNLYYFTFMAELTQSANSRVIIFVTALAR